MRSLKNTLTWLLHDTSLSTWKETKKGLQLYSNVIKAGGPMMQQFTLSSTELCRDSSLESHKAIFFRISIPPRIFHYVLCLSLKYRLYAQVTSAHSPSPVAGKSRYSKASLDHSPLPPLKPLCKSIRSTAHTTKKNHVTPS